ncbi:serine hydrolase domain-containing protein [Robertkochia solimangrovi]|uniref:serine hydrolase domain-containing protein n=1 Tax=Robertkochia solimangrovi TaxID=2213046 RepID=UPI00117F34BB|nr:serine hydrolase [Robertkochia solimangrovi]TRZ42144.1 hypothetical protein DMZ48_14000 [Robertkochia solimangrovi]
MRYARLIIIFLLFSGCNSREKDSYNISDETEQVIPEELGVDSGVLADMIYHLRSQDRNVNSIVIKRYGKTILNADFYPQEPNDLHTITSISKSIVSLLVGIAIDKGIIKNENEPIRNFFPDKERLFDTDTKRSITIKDLLTMRSGICPGMDQGERFLDRFLKEETTLEYLLHGDLFDQPGTKFVYCSPGVAILIMILTRVTGKELDEYAREVLFEPLGITAFKYRTGEEVYRDSSGEFYLKSDDLAIIGELVLQNGRWKGKQMISGKWIRNSLKKQVVLPGNEGYGYLWWLREGNQSYIESQGRGGQRLYIFPDEKIVMVIYGSGFEPGGLLDYLNSAIISENAIPENLDANLKLEEQLEAAKQPTRLSGLQEIPDSCYVYFNREFEFLENETGLRKFEIDTSGSGVWQLKIHYNDRIKNSIVTRVIPFGIHGEYVTSVLEDVQTKAAARGGWTQGNYFYIDYYLFSEAHRYENIFYFANDTVRIKFADAGENVRPVLNKAVPVKN